MAGGEHEGNRSGVVSLRRRLEVRRVQLGCTA